jgi:N-acyl-D-aspartate/D-glutamate deacylase
VIAPGYKADINVIDYDKLHLHPPKVHYDLPVGGAGGNCGAGGGPGGVT